MGFIANIFWGGGNFDMLKRTTRRFKSTVSTLIIKTACLMNSVFERTDGTNPRILESIQFQNPQDLIPVWIKKNGSLMKSRV